LQIKKELKMSDNLHQIK